MSQENYKIEVRYNFDTRENRGDALELICFLAKVNVWFDIAVVRNQPVRVRIDGKEFACCDMAQIKELVATIKKREKESRLADY